MTTINSIDARYSQTQARVAAEKLSASVQNLVKGEKLDASVADLSVGTVLASRVNTLRVAVGNAGQGKSVLNTAKGALTTILNLLQQQKSLAVKAADDSLSDNERGFLDQEFQAIVTQIDRIASTTNFNGKLLLDGSIDGTGSSVANLTTVSGLDDEQYTLLNSSDTTSSGTLAVGNLDDSHATFGETTITFAAETGASTETVTFTIDADGAGSVAAQTVTYSAVASATGATIAAAFVAAAQASTASNFKQFEFIDQLDGTVTIRAREAGDLLNSYTFLTDSDGAGDADVDILGNATGIDASGSAQTFSSGTPVVTGTDGAFKVVAANNIADTALNATLTFGADTIGYATSGSVNGIRRVQQFTLTAADTDATSIRFGTDALITFQTTEDGTDNTIGLNVFNTQAEQTQRVAELLNQYAAQGGNDAVGYTFTYNATDVIATANNLGTPDTASFAIIAAGGTLALADNGSVAGEIGVASTTDVTFSVRDAAGATVGEAINVVIAFNTGTVNYTATQIAGFFVDSLNDSNTSASRLFTFTNNNDGTVGIVANEAGTDINGYTLDIDQGGASSTFTTTITGGGNVVTDVVLNTITLANLGTNKSIATGDLTFDPTLQGSITDLQGVFTLGAGNNGTSDANNNTVQFTAVVGGKTYTSQNVILTGSTASSQISDTIRAGTLLTFQSASGPTNDSGAYTNAGFQLAIEDATTLSSVTSSTTGQNSLNTIITGLQNQLDAISIESHRAIVISETDAANGDHTLTTAAVGSTFEGIVGFDAVGTDRNSYAKGDITLISDQFASAGTHGRVGQFTFDSTLDAISTTINGEVFTAYLNSSTAPTSGGVRVYGLDHNGAANDGSYNTTTKIIDLDDETDTGNNAKFIFYSADTTDGRRLEIDLGNVVANTATIDLSTAAKQTTFTDDLNLLFGVSTAATTDSSLSFQVGVAATDTITVTIGAATTSGIYKDASGVAQTISVDTKANSIIASDILDRALNATVALVATVSANITAFNASIENNNSSIQNADAARSNLLDTDYTVESTNFAERKLSQSAAISVLASSNSHQDLKDLLRTLQQ